MSHKLSHYCTRMSTGPSTVQTGAPGDPTACQTDVKKCPDGSYVGRDPDDNCAFHPCSGEDILCIEEKETDFPTSCRSCQTARCAHCRCKDSCDAPGCPEVVTQKRIWGQVRAASSSYEGALSALTVHGGPANRPRKRWNMVNWNQMSDRAVPHLSLIHI